MFLGDFGRADLDCSISVHLYQLDTSNYVLTVVCCRPNSSGLTVLLYCGSRTSTAIVRCVWVVIWTRVNIIEVLKKYRTKPKILSFIKVHLSEEGEFILCYCPFNIPSSTFQAVLVSVFPFVIFPLESHFHSFKEHLSAIILPNCKAVGMREPKLATDAMDPRTTVSAGG